MSPLSKGGGRLPLSLGLEEYFTEDREGSTWETRGIKGRCCRLVVKMIIIVL